MLHFMSLYDSVLVPILSEWINDEDLCYLDTAVCAQELRNSFLRVLALCSIVNTDTHKHSLHYKPWVIRRNIRLKKYLLDNKATSEEIVLIKRSKHLHQLIGEDYSQLRDFLASSGVTTDSVVWTHKDARGFLFIDEEIGPLISHLTFNGFDYRDMETSAKACPNLRYIKLHKSEFLLPFIEHCPLLDTIDWCYLDCLVEGGRVGDCYCQLKRSSVVDESVVRLGDASAMPKYFNLTGLFARDFSDTDVLTLAPMVKHLTTLEIINESPLIAHIVSKCHLLTTLEVNTPQYQADVLKLLSHSPNLKKFHSLKDPVVSADPYLDCLSQYCPLLQKCVIVAMEMSPVSLNRLFDGCNNLNDFLYNATFGSVWIVSHSAFNLFRHAISMSVFDMTFWQIPETIAKIYPRINGLNISTYAGEENSLNSILVLLPALTQLPVSGEVQVQPEHLKHLKTLKLRRKSEISLELLQCKESIQILSLVNVSSIMLGALDESFASPTRLDVCCDDSIENKHIVLLLQKCTTLQELSISHCKSITCDILVNIKSVSLQSLFLSYTGITEKNLNPSLVASVSYRVAFN